MSLLRRGVSCLLLCLLVGCGNRDTIETVKVSGQVTLDDKPLENGLIQFVPQNGRGAIAANEIHDGKYAVDVVPGLMRVEVTSPKVVGQKQASSIPGSPVVDLLAERVPREFNAESKLHVDISREKTKFDFSLTTIPAK